MSLAAGWVGGPSERRLGLFESEKSGGGCLETRHPLKKDSNKTWSSPEWKGEALKGVWGSKW